MRDINDIVEIIRKHDDINIGVEAESLANQMEPVMYACPVCGKHYETVDEAEACRDQPYDDGGLKLGDIVVVPGKITYWMGVHDPWIAFTIPADPKASSHFERKDQHVPYYVVTAFHGDRDDAHRCLVTLCSLAGGAITVGWNPANGDGHHSLFRPNGDKHCDIGSTWIEAIGPYLEGLEPPAQVIEEAARLARVGISSRNLL